MAGGGPKEGSERGGVTPGEPVPVGLAQAPWGYLALAVSDGEVSAAAPGATRGDAALGLAPLGGEARSDPGADALARRAVEVAVGGSGIETLPLRMVGTSFRLEVWEALCRASLGTTITYSELAAGIGRPGAVRAVASACAANRLGILVPCHRVVRSDGSIGGYRWGEALKHRIIEMERASGADSTQAAGDEAVLRSA